MKQFLAVFLAIVLMVTSSITVMAAADEKLTPIVMDGEAMVDQSVSSYEKNSSNVSVTAPETEPSTQPLTEPTVSDKTVFLNVDSNLYEVNIGSVHSYAYYVRVKDQKICGVDARTVWDTPAITILDEPSFPLIDSGTGSFILNDMYEGKYIYNYASIRGTDFSAEDSILISFKLRVSEHAVPGETYYINTFLKTLEGTMDKRMIFENFDYIPPTRKEVLLDDLPGIPTKNTYTADEQIYQKGTGEAKAFTVNGKDNDDNTFYKFSALYIDGEFVSYDKYTTKSGSLKLTLKPRFLDTLEPGAHNMKFVFYDGEAIGTLRVQASPSHPDNPPGIGAICFDAATAGWSGTSAVSFYIYEIGGDKVTEWGAKNEDFTGNDGDFWTFQAAEAGVLEGKEYGIIFVNLDTGAQTADLLFNTGCFGDTAYVPDPDDLIEDAVDSDKKSMIARWGHADLGPIKQITSLGNVVGESIPANTTPYQMMVNFLASKGAQSLTNALHFHGKDAQTTIDDIAAQLNLTKEDVAKAIKEAATKGANDGSGDKTDWSGQWDAAKSSVTEFVLGDADGDGQIALPDVTNLQKYLSKLKVDTDEKTLMYADVDRNGTLEIIDVVLIQRHLAGIDIPYPIGG